MKLNHPDYMGDGVYVGMANWGTVVLTTEHHDPTLARNVIHLEPAVLRNLLNYLERIKGIENEKTQTATI